MLERLAGIMRKTVDELVVLTKILFPDGATKWTLEILITFGKISLFGCISWRKFIKSNPVLT